MEDGISKFRAKKLPYHPDSELVPRAGIRLVKDLDKLDEIGPSNFRVESIDFDSIIRGLEVHLKNMPFEKQVSIRKSWKELRSRIENAPFESTTLQKMNLSSFPKQTAESGQETELHQYEEVNHELKGDVYPENVQLGSIENEASVGMDVVIRTSEKKWRPWLGRIVKIQSKKVLIIQWYKRKTNRSRCFYAVRNEDGSPYLNEISTDAIMFWLISEPQSRKEDNFSLTPYSLLCVDNEYKAIDESI